MISLVYLAWLGLISFGRLVAALMQPLPYQNA